MARRMIAVRRRLDVAAYQAWDALTDLELWPKWGPSVRAARLDGGGSRLSPGSHGTVQTAFGVSLPFRVTEWEEGRRWSWVVAGVAATSHTVRAGDGTCVATIEVPVWAPAYVPVCWLALGRLGRVAAAGQQ